jgi:hypothetical protein
MFLNTIHSERIKQGMKQKINENLSRHMGLAYVGNRIMGAAFTLFFHFSNLFFGNREYHVEDFLNFQLVTLYQAATEILQDQELDDNAINIMQRFLFVLRTMHTVHYVYVIFPYQWRYIFRRRLSVAMALHARLGLGSIMSQLDESLIRLVALSLHEGDENVNNFVDYELLKDRWENFFQNEGRL